MHNILAITWDMANGLPIGSFTLRYYSLLFAGGFFAGYFVIKKMLARDKTPDAWLDSLVTYMVVATVLGARLGHVFFYEWDYYKEHPGKILAVWEGGLASHGAAIAIIIALIIYSQKITKRSPLWILDRIVVVVALAACFIRLGNYMNSEIYGKAANSAIETVFVDPARQSILNSYGDKIYSADFTPTTEVFTTDSINYPKYLLQLSFNQEFGEENALNFTERYIASRLNTQASSEQNFWVAPNTEATAQASTQGILITMPVYGIPRYPTQLIEAAAYLLIFFFLLYLFWRTETAQKGGYLFGMFLILLFGFRFFVEYLKADQVDFEATMSLNMGQWLSIPLVLTGLYFVLTSKKSKNEQL